VPQILVSSFGERLLKRCSPSSLQLCCHRVHLVCLLLLICEFQSDSSRKNALGYAHLNEQLESRFKVMNRVWHWSICHFIFILND
jgi:hypothetical protein